MLTGGPHLITMMQEAERRRNDFYAEAERERRARLAQPRGSYRPPWPALLVALAIVAGLAWQLAAAPEEPRRPLQPGVAPAERADDMRTREAELLDPGAARQVDASRW